MVLLTLSKKLSRWLGPNILRYSIPLRYKLGKGVIRDSLITDSYLLMPFAQSLIRIELRDSLKDIQDKTGESNDETDTTAHEQSAVPHSTTQSASKKYATTAAATSRKTKTGNKKEDIVHEYYKQLSEQRVKLLEHILRRSLVPNEKWSDVRNWQFHSRLIKWIRTEYLLAHHGPYLQAALYNYPYLANHPQLQGIVKQGNMFTRLKLWTTRSDDASVLSNLPTTERLANALDYTNHVKLTKSRRKQQSSMREIAKSLGGQVHIVFGGGLAYADIQSEADTSSVPLEHLLELVGAQVCQSTLLNVVCEEADAYQLWTRDYIEHLGDYLLKQAGLSGRPTTILDVGAGDGLLAAALREYFVSLQSTDSSLSVPTVIATDNGSWKIPADKAPVLPLDVDTTLAMYANKPEQESVIVLCSWMPMQEDWTAAFRQYKVDEYILIGEADDGQCGDNWATWGNPAYHEDADEHDGSNSEITTLAPYEVDAYERREMAELLPYQLSRYDSHVSKVGTTVSFRRSKR
jgi:hypothetical protein